MTRSREQAIAGVMAGLIGPDEEVTWEAHHFGLRVRMTSRITEYDRPRAFTDEQVSGPFASWWHRHTFEPEQGGTRMTDTVRYSSPGGPLGRLFDWAFLRRYVTRLLDRRKEFLKDSLEAR
jgi:ligand-binding SRPBCC domain-containing protein